MGKNLVSVKVRVTLDERYDLFLRKYIRLYHAEHIIETEICINVLNGFL